MGAKLSNPPNWAEGFKKEIFTPIKRVVLSESTGYALYRRSCGKQTLVFFYYHAKGWWNFVPTCAHLVGMAALESIYRAVERENSEILRSDRPEPWPVNPGIWSGNIMSDPTLRVSSVEDLSANGFSTLTTQAHQDVMAMGCGSRPGPSRAEPILVRPGAWL